MKKKQGAPSEIDLEKLQTAKEELFKPALELFEEGITDGTLIPVSEIMQFVEFFKQSCPESSNIKDFTKLCCSNLVYEKFAKDQAVFHIDQPGDKFYIILKGRCGIYIKKSIQQIEQEELAMQAKIVKIQKSMTDVYDTKRYCERVLKRQSKPQKVLETELILLRNDRYENYFTDAGICRFQQIAQLIAGQYFGEMALTNDKPRGATIIALEDLCLVSLNKENYKKVFEKEIKAQQLRIAYFMKLFPTITKFKMNKLILYFEQIQLQAYSTIWKQGDPVTGLFHLKDGEVQAEQTIEYQIQQGRDMITKKDNVILAQLESGCFLGDIEVLNSVPKRILTVKTNAPSLIYTLSLDNFQIVKKQFPDVITMLQVLSEKSNNFFRQRAEEIKQVRNTPIKVPQPVFIERRYAQEMHELKNDLDLDDSSPIIRQNMMAKLTKHQITKQNQNLSSQMRSIDISNGEELELNMLKMAGNLFQKRLMIRVEKQFEQFKPTKPKGNTPHFSKQNKDIKDLLYQISQQQFPPLDIQKTNQDLSFRFKSEDKYFYKERKISRILHPGVMYRSQQLKEQSRTIYSQKQTRREPSFQSVMLTETPAHPLHSTKHKKTTFTSRKSELDETQNTHEELFAPALKLFKEGITSEEQLNAVSEIMQNVEFFKQSCPETSNIKDFTRLCCQNLVFEEFQKQEAVFHIDEQGDKFYIILSGRCGIYVRKQEAQIAQDEAAMTQKIQKIKEHQESRGSLFEPLKYFEKILKKQSKPQKIIENEAILLGNSKFEQYFTPSGMCRFQQIAQKIAGEYFGEMALMNDKPRGASIIALSDIQLVSLSKANYKKVFEKEIRAQQQKIEYFMKLFPAMTKFKMSKMILYFEQVQLLTNVVIWKQNDPVDGFFHLRTGQLQVEQNIDVKSAKQKIILAQLEQGCFVGDTDLGNQTRAFTVKTIQPSLIYTITNENYQMVKKLFPEVTPVMNTLCLKSKNFFTNRANEVKQTKENDHYLEKKVEEHFVERRYANEFQAQNAFPSPIVRSSTMNKLTKHQVTQQNQTIYQTKREQNQEEFNMLSLAGDNFQKCLTIRVGKQFEQFQPSKPKGKTPYFSRTSRDIYELMEQIKKTQLPSLSNKTARISNRIIHPSTMYKADLRKHGKSLDGFQYQKQIQQASGIIFQSDLLATYKPLHSNSNRKQMMQSSIHTFREFKEDFITELARGIS